MGQNTSLVFDRRAEIGGGPAVHALIAGVGRYPYLPGGSGPVAKVTFGLRQLTTAAATVRGIRSWLEKNSERLPVPLGTIRMLLSADDAGPDAEPCTLENFTQATYEWREDALAHRQGVTWLYLIGHGVGVRREDRVYLLEDFGKPFGSVMRNAVDVSNLVHGMSPFRGQYDIAQSQRYFFDLGSVTPERPHAAALMNLSLIFDTDLPGIDRRDVSTYYASDAGEAAYAIAGGMTLFSDALLECLDGGEGAAVMSDSRWSVTSNSLLVALGRAVRRRAERAGITQSVFGGTIGQGVVCYLDGPPLVEIKFVVERPAAGTAGRVELSDSANQVVQIFELDADHHAFRARIPAGIYRVTIIQEQPVRRVHVQLAMFEAPAILELTMPAAGEAAVP